MSLLFVYPIKETSDTMFILIINTNRKDSYRPMLLNPLKEYLAENYTTFQRPQLEADDVMGILATRKQKEPTRFIIISTDKDLKQIPSHHYNPDKQAINAY